MLLVSALAALSLGAFAYAVRLTMGLIADRAQRRARIARAVRPIHGAAIACAPVVYRNRLGED